jgi:hypothetical protein
MMATYRFRLIDKYGEVLGVHYLSLESDADAQQYADTAIGEYDCEPVEVWLGDSLVCVAMQRLS